MNRSRGAIASALKKKLGLDVHSEKVDGGKLHHRGRVRWSYLPFIEGRRDRDRLRQSVLEELNWRIHRVWSTDWYRDPEREFSRLLQSIERIRGDAPLPS